MPLPTTGITTKAMKPFSINCALTTIREMLFNNYFKYQDQLSAYSAPNIRRKKCPMRVNIFGLTLFVRPLFAGLELVVVVDV